MAKNPVPDSFEFRHFDRGPEKDVAVLFYELVQDLGWLKPGHEWDDFVTHLLKAREHALVAAKTMLRS